MLANRLVAEEGLSRDFRYKVEVLSDNARIPLKKMMGKMVAVSLVREDGTLRHFNGYVTEFRLIKADGGYAWYGMVLEPWLAFTKLRKNCAVFLERTVMEITEEIFNQYPQRDWKLELYNQYEPLSCAIQYEETDHNHLHRRWEDLGLHYWYEHRADGHTLRIGDMTQMQRPIEPGGNVDVPDDIPFRRNAGSARRTAFTNGCRCGKSDRAAPRLAASTINGRARKRRRAARKTTRARRHGWKSTRTPAATPSPRSTPATASPSAAWRNATHRPSTSKRPATTAPCSPAAASGWEATSAARPGRYAMTNRPGHRSTGANT